MQIVNGIKKLAAEDGRLFKPAESFRCKETGLANSFLVNIANGSKAYRYDVNILLLGLTRDDKEYEKNLAKGSDEGLRSRNRNLCYEVLAIAYNQTGAFGIDGDIVYDCKSTLYTSKPIVLQDRNIFVEHNATNEFIRLYCGPEARFRVSISDNATGHVLDLSDLTQYINKDSLASENRSIRTFLEMAVAQTSINNMDYCPIGAGKLFEVKTGTPCGNAMELRSGVAKGARIVQNFGSPCPAIVIDAKVCPFFISQDLERTVLEMCRNRPPQTDREYDQLRFQLLDLRVELKKQRYRTFSIKGFSKSSAEETMFNFNGQQISVYNYCLNVLDIKLQYPKWRCIISDKRVAAGEDPEYYPVELCFVMPDQRVPLEKMDKQLSLKLLQVNSILPQARMDMIINHANRMRLFDPNNTVLNSFGITVLRDSNKVDIGVRQCPRIEFADRRMAEVNPREVEWKRGSSGLRFLETHNISSWIILCHESHKDEVRRFIPVFIAGARRRGLVFERDPVIPLFEGQSWDDLFGKCVEKAVELVVLIDPLAEDTHGLLKYYEAKYKVLTQHITYERARDIVNDPRKKQTLENILNKTNCKAWGLNYLPLFEESANMFALEKNQTLVLGYDIANPPPLSRHDQFLVNAANMNLQSFDPSVVGITANVGAHPHNFVGDYFYQTAQKDFLDLEQLADRIKWLLETLEMNRPHAAAPPFIFVLRNGLSEGQFALSVQKEMEALREGCRRYKEGYSPKFVYVVGTKRHFKKFFAERQRIENLTPGSVIDTKFVREDCPEFFMMSHYPLKGVGKPVEYNVLVDDVNISKDELQGLLNSLCFSHQIVNSAVSLPVPIYEADELAKRGRNNYITMKRLEQQLIPRVGEANLVDAAQLTGMISYKNSDMCSTRFTA